MDNRLEKHLKKFKKRIFIRRFSRYFMKSLAVSLLLILVLIIVSKFYPLFIINTLQKILLIIPLVLSILAALFKRASNFEAAREADYNGLDEIVVSAYEGSQLAADDGINSKLYEEAIVKLDNLEDINKVKILTDKKWIYIILILFILIIPISMIKTDISTNVNAELKEIKKIKEIEERVEKKLDEIDSIKSKELLKDLKEALKDIHNPAKIDEEIFKVKKELNEEVKKNIEFKLSQNDLSNLSAKEKNDILSSDNSLETLENMLNDSQINKNTEDAKELKELLESVSDKNTELSKEAIEKLEELNEKIDEHNESSDSRGAT